MKTSSIDNTKFQGKLVIENGLSNKPKKCIKKVKNNLESLIFKKDFNLYIKQDYTQNTINITAKHPFPYKPSTNIILLTNIPEETLPINAKTSKYIDSTKNAIDKYEKALANREQKEWELKQKHKNIEDIKDIVGTIIFLPLFLVNDVLHSIKPKWSKNFEKLIIDRL